jgi:hypothetical protein
LDRGGDAGLWCCESKTETVQKKIKIIKSVR